MSEAPLGDIWLGLRNGDPGPALALFDLLLASDLPFAAGGFVRDIAERLHDASDHLQPPERERFLRAAREVVTQCLDGDTQEIAALLTETQGNSAEEP